MIGEVAECEVNEEFHLLIPSRFPPVPLYTRLGDADIQRAAEALEAKTNPRLREERRRSQMEPQASPHQLQNWNLAPFAYANPTGTSLLGPGYRVLELVKGVRPALAHALLRREAFLASTEEPPVRIEMRLISRNVSGGFADLTSAPLDMDPDSLRRIGAQIYSSEARGILFRRHDLCGTRAIAVFDGGALGRAVQSDHFRFEWDGYQITQIGNLSSHQVLDRDELFDALGDEA